MHPIPQRASRTQDVYDPATVDLRDSIAVLVFRVRTAFMARLDQALLADEALKELEVTAMQFAIITHVLEGAVTTAGELCALLDYDCGAMSRMIDRLESRGLIRRAPFAHNRRKNALEVTPEGMAAYPRMKACLTGAINRSLHGLSCEEVRETERVLKRILANS